MKFWPMFVCAILTISFLPAFDNRLAQPIPGAPQTTTSTIGQPPTNATTSISSSTSQTTTTIQPLVPFQGTVASTSQPSKGFGQDLGTNTVTYTQLGIQMSRNDSTMTIGLPSLQGVPLITQSLKNSTNIRYSSSGLGNLLNYDVRNTTNQYDRQILISGNALGTVLIPLSGSKPAQCDTQPTFSQIRNQIIPPCTRQYFGTMAFDWSDIPSATYNNLTRTLTIPVNGQFLFDPLALDGSNQCFALAATSSCTLALTTAHANDVCVTSVIVSPGNTYTNPTDVVGMTFSQRYSHTLGSVKSIESYGIATGTLSAAVITFTGSVADDLSAIAFCVSGANTSTPFDPNVSLPAFCNIQYTAPGTGSNCSGTFSTSNANDFLITNGGDNHATFCYSATSTYTLIQQICTGAPAFPYDLASQYKVVSTVQSSVTIPTLANTFNGAGTWAIVNVEDAIVAATVAQPIKITTLPAGAPSGTITITGCSPTNSTFTADGFIHHYVLTPSCTVTLTTSGVVGNTYYAWDISPHPTASVSITFLTCASGTCSQYANNTYYLLSNIYKANPQTPTTWDGAYSWSLVANILGSTGITVACPNSTVQGAGIVQCFTTGFFFFNYNSPVTFLTPIGNTWIGQAPITFTDTTGGNTHTVNYIQQVSTTTSTVTTTTTVTSTSTVTTTTITTTTVTSTSTVTTTTITTTTITSTSTSTVTSSTTTTTEANTVIGGNETGLAIAVASFVVLAILGGTAIARKRRYSE